MLGRSWCWWRGGCGCRSSRWGSRHSRGCRCCTGSSRPTRAPLVAIDALGANPGLTLLFGLATAIPTVLVAGPLFAKLAVRWVPVTAPDVAPDGKADVPAEAPEEQRRGRVGVVRRWSSSSSRSS